MGLFWIGLMTGIVVATITITIYEAVTDRG